MSRRRRPSRRRRGGQSRGRGANGPVSAALAPYRKPLIDDSQGFTQTSLALAQATVSADPLSTKPTPEQLAALAALAAWQQDVQLAQTSVAAVDTTAVGQALATQWLGALSTSLSLLYQSLSLTNTDSKRAADLATSARQSLDESHALADSLAKAIA